MRALVVLILSCVSLGAAAWGEAPGDRAHALAERARASTEAEQWADAGDTWRSVLRESPDHAEAVGELRRLYREDLLELQADEASVAALRDALGTGFYRIETDWFVVLSDCDEVWTAARAGVLERTARQYRNMMDRLGLAWIPPEHKMVCVLFAEHGDFVAFAKGHDGVEATWVSGYYATASNRVAFYDEATSPGVRRAVARLEEAAADSRLDPSVTLEQARNDLMEHARKASVAKTVHEAIHMLAFNCGLQDRSRSYPFWFTEGLASAFETTEPRHNFGPTIEQPDVRAQLRSFDDDGRLMDMTELIGVVDANAVDAEKVSVMYAMSNSFFRYLYRFEREGLASYTRALWDAEPGRMSPGAHADLFRAHIGDENKLARRWLERWVRAE